jgi:hypothetical protein
MTARIRKRRFLVPAAAIVSLIGGLVAMPLQLAPPRDRILWQRDDGSFSSCALLWELPDLNEQNLVRLYGQLSREFAGKTAWTAGVFLDAQDANRELHGKMRTEGDYEWWLTLYNEYGRTPLPMAEISAYNGNAVLRLRDGAGKTSETVLAGQNFLRIHLGTVDYEILKTYYHPLPPFTDPAPGDEAMISVYVRASSFPTSDQALTFSSVMRDRFRQKRLVVAFRTDSYFLTDSTFPVIYRFAPSGPPPSREQYARERTMYCFCDAPEIRCR